MSIDSMDALLRHLLRRLGFKGYRDRCYYAGGYRQTAPGDMIVMPWSEGQPPPAGWTVSEESKAMYRIVQAGDVDWSDGESAVVTPLRESP